MTTATIRQRLYEYIKFADEKKVKAFYTIIAEEPTGTTEWWHDRALLDTVKQIDADMESGKDKGISWPEAKKQLLLRGKK